MPWLTDPSITNQMQPAPNPLEAYMRFAQLKQMGQEQQYNQARLAHLTQEDARSKAMLPTDVQGAQAGIAERLSKLHGEQLDQLAKSNGMAAQYLSAVDNAPPEMKPQVYQQVHDAAVRDQLIPPGVAPDQWGPQAEMFVKQKLAQAVTVQQGIQNELNSRKQKDTEAQNAAAQANMVQQRTLQASGQTETARNHRAEEAIAKLRESRVASNEAKPKTELAVTPDGMAIEIKAGMKVPDGTKPASQYGKPTADEQRRADLSQNLNENLDTLEEIVNRRPDLFGPVAGRITGLKNSLGTNDPDIATLETIKHQMGMAQISAHGMRSAQGIGEAARSLTNNFNNSPTAIKASITAARKSVQTFTDDVNKAKGGGGGISVQAPNGKTYNFPDQASADRFKKAANIQ